jgi:hypothetical protein
VEAFILVSRTSFITGYFLCSYRNWFSFEANIINILETIFYFTLHFSEWRRERDRDRKRLISRERKRNTKTIVLYIEE